MIGCPVSGFVPSYTTYKIPARQRVNRHHRLRLIAGQVNALLGRHLELLLPVAVHIEHRVFRVVVQVRVLRGAHLLQRVGPNLHLVVQAELALNIPVKCRSSQPDHHNHYADVNNVAAVSARIAPRQQPDAGGQVAPRLARDDCRSAQKL